MKWLLLQVGRPRDPEAGALHDRYAERIRHFGVEYRVESVPEVRAGGRYSDAHVREREARALLDKLPRNGTVIALDPAGSTIDTRQLADRIERWSSPRGTFLIGGPLGLHARVTERADFVWSLSPLTFPHELARVILVEQLYRSLTLKRGVPYHK